MALRQRRWRSAAHRALAHALQVCGRIGDATRHQQHALELALRLGDATEIVQNSCNLATLKSLHGEPLDAWRSAQAADERLGALGATDAHWVYNRITLARCAAHLGRLGEAVAMIDSVSSPAGAAGASMALMDRVVRVGIDGRLGRGALVLALLWLVWATRRPIMLTQVCRFSAPFPTPAAADPHGCWVPLRK
ncbi:MAG: hypothetical protein H7Z19_10975 [Chitinophagaceae bacterium]|nr:hypothetical protein [Rubrivivax sp.]